MKPSFAAFLARVSEAMRLRGGSGRMCLLHLG
jgi:hypothetical protein